MQLLCNVLAHAFRSIQPYQQNGLLLTTQQRWYVCVPEGISHASMLAPSAAAA
jgi:hypothetical protein